MCIAALPHNLTAGVQQEDAKKKAGPKATGKEIVDTHMAQWKRKNPAKVADWIAIEPFQKITINRTRDS